jgi:hypothetical protein
MIFLRIGLIISSVLFFQNENISFHLESQNLSNGKVIKVKADIYYKYSEGKMVTHYTYPFDYIIVTNRKGEAQVYNPKTNTVVLRRGLLYSTDNDVMNLFLSERFDDMGLKDINFKVSSSKKDNGYMVTNWIPGKEGNQEVSRIELVHDQSVPIYTGVYNKKDKIDKKVYYSNYNYCGRYYIPSRITEITFFPKGDSVISKKEYSNFKIASDISGEYYFNFSVPKDAKTSAK